jgi:hypothetical protein
MHSVEYGYAPASFINTWAKNNAIQGDRPLRNADDYTLPNPRTEMFKKSPLYNLPFEWNSLDYTKFISNRTTFKTALKFNLLELLINNDPVEGAAPPPLVPL